MWEKNNLKILESYHADKENRPRYWVTFVEIPITKKIIDYFRKKQEKVEYKKFWNLQIIKELQEMSNTIERYLSIIYKLNLSPSI